MAAFHAVFPPVPVGARPTVLFHPSKTISDDTNTVVLTHYDPAHTDTDISVYFKQADVLHTGDTWFNGFYPFIDYSTGGTIDGMIHAAKTQLAAYLEMLTTIRGKVADLKKQGKTLDETVAAKPTSAYDDPWGKGFMNPATFISLVYQGV